MGTLGGKGLINKYDNIYFYFLNSEVFKEFFSSFSISGKKVIFVYDLLF